MDRIYFVFSTHYAGPCLGIEYISNKYTIRGFMRACLNDDFYQMVVAVADYYANLKDNRDVPYDEIYNSVRIDSISTTYPDNYLVDWHWEMNDTDGILHEKE